MANNNSVLGSLIEKHQDALINAWVASQKRNGSREIGTDTDVMDFARQVIDHLHKGITGGRSDDITGAEWTSMRELLEDFSRSRATRGFSPSETAVFVFSLKEPLFDMLRQELGANAEQIGRQTWTVTRLLDGLGLYTIECYARTREEVIGRQQMEMLELSTPVVELWEGVLALPLIGTLDSARTQIVMENLLERIVESGAEIAIIDITGVPTVDTLVAQHLIKTISAARLMGADCILSGIRPQIAQTIVHLGLELNVVSKATMADALGLALRRTGKVIVERARPAETGS
jgi:rsbT co-antagonist protein RsbR